MDLRSPRPDSHLEPLVDLFAATFSDYWQRHAYAGGGYMTDSPYDWEASRIGTVNGEIATHFGVWDFSMRIGAAVVRLAGIGAVATAHDQRGKGLMAETAAECVSGLSDAGYDVSLLFGIPNFYHRFGYVPCFPEVRTILDVRELPASPGLVEYEKFDGPFADLADVYNRENEGVTGTYVRPTYLTNRRPKKFTAYRFTDGYVVGGREGNSYQIADCAGDPEKIVEIARQRAAADLCSEIVFVFLPLRSRTGEHLRTLTHRVTSDRNRTGGPMMKIVNLERVFEKVVPALNERLGSSALHSYSGTLAVYCDGEGVVLGISGGSIGEITPAAPNTTANGSITAGRGLARLLIGDGDPLHVCRQSGSELDGDARHLVPVLFPDQEPSTILWDTF